MEAVSDVGDVVHVEGVWERGGGRHDHAEGMNVEECVKGKGGLNRVYSISFLPLYPCSNLRYHPGTLLPIHFLPSRYEYEVVRADPSA